MIAMANHLSNMLKTSSNTNLINQDCIYELFSYGVASIFYMLLVSQFDILRLL